MSDLFKQMCIMAGQLNDLIAETTDKAEQTQLIEKYNVLCKKIGAIAARTFNENDEFYQATIKKIKDTETVILKFKNSQKSLIDFLKYLTGIIENVNRIILGWKF